MNMECTFMAHSHRWLMQQPYIDDRRMALYGKVAMLLYIIFYILYVDWKAPLNVRVVLPT